MKNQIRIIVFVLLISSFFVNPIKAQNDVTYYYSEKFVKNAVFTWNVEQSINYFEDLPKNSNFTVKLKDPLYPGPMTEADLSKIYITIDVDGEKYTGNGFPLFWHIRKLNNSVETTIKEEFENNPEVFNVSSLSESLFRAGFTIYHVNYTLTIEMDIDSVDGITNRYYEHFTDNVDLEYTFELVFIDYAVEASFQFIGVLIGFSTLTLVLVILRRRKKK